MISLCVLCLVCLIIWSVTGSGRQPPRWPLITLNSYLYIVFFHIEFELVGMTIKESEVTVCDFWGKIIKGVAAFTLIYWIAHSVEIQLPCHENTWAALVENSTWRRTEAFHQQPAPTSKLWVNHFGTMLEVNQVGTMLEAILYLGLESHETLSQNCLAKPLLNLWPREAVTNNKCLLFTPLVFGVICYAAISN